MEKVSVILPIYNVEEYLKRSLDSAVNQTYTNLEIICVNDCSPDNSMEILKSYAAKDNRIKIIERMQNGGVSAARNSGLEAATGDYIYFLDPDDWIDSDYIEKMVNVATKSGAEVVLNTNIIAHKGEGEVTHFSDKTYNNISDEFVNAKEAILNIVWNTWAHLWKKSFLDKINASFPEGYIIEDEYFQATTYIYLDKIYVTRTSTYHYSIRDTSIMGRLKKDVFYPNLNILCKIFDYYMENNLENKLHNVRMITETIFPKNCPDKYKHFTDLKKYFTKIEKYINDSRSIYTRAELALFDDTLTDIEKAMKIKYGNLYVFDKLRQNIAKENVKR